MNVERTYIQVAIYINFLKMIKTNEVTATLNINKHCDKDV